MRTTTAMIGEYATALVIVCIESPCANDGTTRSDDEFDEQREEEQEQEQDQEREQVATYNEEVTQTPEMTLKSKFDAMELDQQKPRDSVDEKKSEGDYDDDYQPVAASHYQPALGVEEDTQEGYILEEDSFHSDDLEDKGAEDAQHVPAHTDEDFYYDPNVATSAFEPFPSEMPETEEEFMAMMEAQKQAHEESTVEGATSHDAETIKSGGSLPSHNAGPVSEQKEEEETNDGNDDDVNNNNDDEDAYNDGDDEYDDYVPKQSHFRSEFIKSPEKESFEVPHPLESDTDEVEDQPQEAEADNARTNDIPIIVEPVHEPVAESSAETSAEHYDVSDTDTLHINDSNVQSKGSSIREITRDQAEADGGFTSATIPNSDSIPANLEEHAYLSDLINSPIPMDEDAEQSNVEHYYVDDSLDVPKENRDSQFYSSVSDYFDDYADEDQSRDQLDLTKSRSRSSGSLSTGSYSLSEHRSSKLSDRTPSLTNRSFQISEVQSVAGSTRDLDMEQQQKQQPQLSHSQSQSQSQQPEANGQLNSALSINMGHWRPNTESYRDQFINDSAVIPPLPKLDTYTRNSMGEIVEDTSSIAPVVTNDSNHLSVSGSQGRNMSMLSEMESSFEVQPPSQSLKEGVYTTPSDTVLPIHIPIDTLSSSNTDFFKEHLSTSSLTTEDHEEEPPQQPTVQQRELGKTKPVSYNVKTIASLTDPKQRIKQYQGAREEEANIDTGLEIWISHALDKVEVVSYKSSNTSHVKKAYAEASNFSRRHTNMGSLLHKRRVIQETSQTAHSFAKGAKGIFSRGRKMIKNEITKAT